MSFLNRELSTMTHYHTQIIKIRGTLYPNAYIYRQLVQAKQFIDSHFSEPIGLKEMAQMANLSKFHFIRLFKIAYQKTPHQYLTIVRMEKAKQLLRNGASVADVCYAVGFDSVSSFKGLFKRYTSRTPSAYQKQTDVPIPCPFLPFGFMLQKSNFQDRG